MHPFDVNKYLRRLITISLAILISANIITFFYLYPQKDIASFPFVAEIINIILIIYALIIPLGVIIYKNSSAFRMISICLFMSVLSAMNTQNFHFLLPFLSFTIIGTWSYVDKETERNNNYSLKINTDDIKGTKNTLTEEHKKNKFLLDALSKKIQEFFRLKKIATTFNYSLTTKEITKKVTEILAKTIEKGDVHSFYLTQNDSIKLRLQNSLSRKEFSNVPKGQDDDFNRWIMLQRQPLFIPDISKEYRFDKHMGNFNKDIKALIASPLKTENKIIGILRIERLHDDKLFNDTFTMDDLRLLAAIANLAALSIKNASLYKETEELAIKDGLTSLYVQRHFRELLPQLINASSHSHFVLLMLDLDKFKKVNDTYGHLVGDTVLRKTAAVLKKECPKSAIISRYGGEEFAIVLPNTSKKGGLAIAETIRRSIQESKIGVRRTKISVTISIGLALYPSDGTDPDTLIMNADKALYKSKETGRNKVSVC